MGSPADFTSDRVVDRIVVNKQRHSQDVHGNSSRHEEQDALRSILSLTDIEDVIFCSDFDPSSVHEEVNAGPVRSALSDDHLGPLFISPVHVANTSKQVRDEALVVDGWKHDRGRSCIDDRVKAIVFPGGVTLELSECIAITVSGVAKSYTFQVGAPEEIFLNQLDRLDCCVSFDIVHLGLSQIDPWKLTWLGKVERELILRDDTGFGQIFDI